MVQCQHVIDLNADPFLPDSLIGISEHRMGGNFQWDPLRVTLYSAREQNDDGWIAGPVLWRRLKRKRPYNANLLDYLLARPDLIPEDWDCKVYFWGTIYYCTGNGLCVRYLESCGDRKWSWNTRWIGNDWFLGHVSAVEGS